MSKQTPAHPTTEERKAFDFFWEHLRRNSHYRSLYAAEAKCFPPRGKEVEAIRRLLGQEARTVPLGMQKVFARLLYVTHFNFIPVSLNPNIDTEEALRLVLAELPNYFESILWQRAQLQTSSPVAAWNPYGRLRAGRANPPRKIGTELLTALVNLEESEQLLLDEEPTARVTKQKRIGAEKSRTWLQQERERAKTTIRKLLAEHPRLDFVLDTSLPWETVSKKLEKQFNLFKVLRKYVGLPRDVQPSRQRDKLGKQLEIWDAVHKRFPTGRPRFDDKLVGKFFPKEVEQLRLSCDYVAPRFRRDEVGRAYMQQLVAYKRGMDKLRSKVRDGFRAADKRITAAYPLNA